MLKFDLRPDRRERGRPFMRMGESEFLPVAVIRLRVIEGARLRAADWSFWSKRTSDPYCVVQLGAAKEKTSVVSRTTDPIWNECFEMLLFDWKQNLSLSVYDYDVAKSDDLLGRVKALPCLRLLQASLEQGFWVQLEDVDADEEQGPVDSQILLAAEALQLRADGAGLHDLVAQVYACVATAS